MINDTNTNYTFTVVQTDIMVSFFSSRSSNTTEAQIMLFCLPHVEEIFMQYVCTLLTYVYKSELCMTLQAKFCITFIYQTHATMLLL